MTGIVVAFNCQCRLAWQGWGRVRFEIDGYPVACDGAGFVVEFLAGPPL